MPWAIIMPGCQPSTSLSTVLSLLRPLTPWGLVRSWRRSRRFPDAEQTAITLEFGTLPLEEVHEAIRADNWLYVHGDPTSAMGAEIKRQIRDAFYCDKDDWKGLVWERAVDILRKGLAGLGG